MAKYLDSTGLHHVYSVFKTKFSALFAPKSHTHDDRYYTESETDTKLETKVSLVSHTTIPKGADLNSVTYQAVGSYGQPASANGSSISNTPVSDAFMLNVYNPLTSNTGNSGKYIYRLQEVIHYSTGRKWYRLNSTNGSGTWSYGAWRQVAFTGESQPASDVSSWAKASSKPSYSKSEVGLGNVANINQSKAIKSITRSGTTFTATALDGTTSTFTQQDNNTTYGVVSTTANGLAPKRDGSTAHFLRGDGTWATPPNTTYTMATNAQIDALF